MKTATKFTGRTFQIELPKRDNSRFRTNQFSVLILFKGVNNRQAYNIKIREKCKKTLQTDLEEKFLKPVEMQEPPLDQIWYLQNLLNQPENPKNPAQFDV